MRYSFYNKENFFVVCTSLLFHARKNAMLSYPPYIVIVYYMKHEIDEKNAINPFQHVIAHFFL